jgi:Spy/CpxP family protein refolding chaperone
MDFLSSKRLVTTTLVILVLLNIALMGVLWWQNFVSGSYHSVEMTRMYNGANTPPPNLELTDKQKTAFMKLRQEHFRKSMPAVQKIIELKKELIAESLKPSPEKKKVAAIADSIGKRQAWLENDLATHFHELAELCTPDQRKSLEKMLGNIYTVRYQKISSWQNHPHKERHEIQNFPPPPPHPQEKPD